MTRLFAALLAALLWLLPQAVAAEDLESLYGRALQASQSGDFVGALPLWDQVLKLSPNDAAALSLSLIHI